MLPGVAVIASSKDLKRLAKSKVDQDSKRIAYLRFVPWSKEDTRVSYTV
jgi:hypothetical protein